MDNLTHSLVGALIGQAGLKRKSGLAMPALIIGANLPDIDAACFFWLDGVEHLAFRRGITHGPPAILLLPLVLAGLLYGYDRWQASRGKRPEQRLPVRFGWLYLLALIGCISHPALDWLNSYGIRLLEPFSSRWFYGDVLFIIDLWLWLGLGLATWLSLRREKRGGDWRRPARIALSAALVYIGFNAAITWRAESNLAGVALGSTIVATPVPVAFWQRDIVYSADDGLIYKGMATRAWSLFGGTTGPETPLSPEGPSCIEPDEVLAYADTPDLRAFLFWSRKPFVTPARDGVAVLRDARFASPMVDDQFSVRFAVPEGAEDCGFD